MKKTVSYSLEETFTACKKALKECGMNIKYSNISEKIIVASTSTSFLSWGETIEVRFIKKGNSKTEVSVKSEADAQLFSWGQNSKNEKEVISILTKILSL